MIKEDAQKITELLGMVWKMVGCSNTGCIKVDVKESQDEIHRLANEVRKSAGIAVVK